MTVIKNPILRGFNPDPSIVRVGDDYYIATSTFEWFPGVQIHHSKDLINWELISRPLSRVTQLNMVGNPSSGGIWAPCLSYDNGQFYLIFTDVKLWKGLNGEQTAFKDSHNYLVTAHDIRGEWSDPIYLNSSGFDPSLFHDDDGRKWLVNLVWDYRLRKKDNFGGIFLQEYDPSQKKLIGDVKKIFSGTELGVTEAPHIYKRNGYYYLMTAEGGTSYEHAVTLARSKNIEGPYEVHPKNPILTSLGDPNLTIQKSGHASICEGVDGNWYMVHLCGRPLEPLGRCILGRETAIQKVVWKEDDWLYLQNGTNRPDEEIEIEGRIRKEEKKRFIYDFKKGELDRDFQTLRIPFNEGMGSLTERPGYLRLYGKESPLSHFRQSLVARRQQSFSVRATTALEFNPSNFLHMGGLVVRYDEYNQFYLRLTFDEDVNKKTLGIVIFDRGKLKMPVAEEIVIEEDKLYLRVEIAKGKLQFYYSKDNKIWMAVGEEYDSSILSDEYPFPMGFTGTFIGMACHDMKGDNLYCDFDYFIYEEID